MIIENGVLQGPPGHDEGWSCCSSAAENFPRWPNFKMIEHVERTKVSLSFSNTA